MQYVQLVHFKLFIIVHKIQRNTPRLEEVWQDNYEKLPYAIECIESNFILIIIDVHSIQINIDSYCLDNRYKIFSVKRNIELRANTDLYLSTCHENIYWKRLPSFISSFT